MKNSLYAVFLTLLILGGMVALPIIIGIAIFAFSILVIYTIVKVFLDDMDGYEN